MNKAEATLIFPHQLFEYHPAVSKDKPAFIIEDQLFFRQYEFHKKKLLLHRASMQFYLKYLRTKKIKVTYVETSSPLASLEKLFSFLHLESIRKIHFCDPADYLLKRRLLRFASKYEIQVVEYESPCFLNSREALKKYFDNRENYFLHHFYIQQRKRLGLLVHNNKPVGGQWSFDADNRKKIPKSIMLPQFPEFSKNNFLEEAETYVNSNFAVNKGAWENFIYPVTFDQAKNWLENFLQNRFHLFGPYEDAMLKNESFLFHSVLTSSMNIGLITPAYVLERVIEASAEFKIPLPSLEGFIRQLIGWREFMRGVYQYQGTYQRTRNFWNHTRMIPDSFYTGTTGILPVDAVIKRVNHKAYCHHIERLMVLGNFMLLCEFNPDEIYKWFMELFIDAYDWVMVPNVYGMSQFADGGLMSTKPYLSSSNYIVNMSDFPKGRWCEIWNALYWRFIYRHHDFFASNQRTVMISKNLERMNKTILSKHFAAADNFLAKLEKG